MQAKECGRKEVYRHVMFLSDVSIGATVACGWFQDRRELIMGSLLRKENLAFGAAVILSAGFFF